MKNKLQAGKLLLILAAAGLVVALLGVIAFNTTTVQDALLRLAISNVMSQPSDEPEGLRVVICGSASPLGNDPARAQACIAVLTPEHYFLFDVGARSPTSIAQARLPMARLDGVFLTHFHSDHIAALPDVNLTSWVQGRKSSLPVYGPPGIQTVVDGFNLAYQLDRAYRTEHHGSALLPPSAGPMTPVSFSPGSIAWQDELMTISTFAVDHEPVAPAVGYRVDYRGRSVVISGDSVASDSLFEAARGADLLLHDALSRALLDPMISVAGELNVPILPTIMTDVIDYHADTRTLEVRAADAGIGTLAFYHLVPVPANALAELIFARGLDSKTLLVRDLQTFELPAGSTEIDIHEP